LVDERTMLGKEVVVVGRVKLTNRNPDPTIEHVNCTVSGFVSIAVKEAKEYTFGIALNVVPTFTTSCEMTIGVAETDRVGRAVMEGVG
jgi:phosphoenolpyruvate carboxylase